MSLPVKTTIQQKYVRDYSVMWFSKYSEDTNSFTFCRYSSNSLGADGKFREAIQTPSISFQSPWLCLCSCKEAVTKSSSCLLTHGCLGTISNFYVPNASRALYVPGRLVSWREVLARHRDTNNASRAAA